MWRRLILILHARCHCWNFVIPLNPVNSMILKLAFLGCVIGAWIGFTILVWKRKPLRIGCLDAPIGHRYSIYFPGGKIDAEELRQDYVRRMAAFEGTKYYWGGESSRGIDCSGLPRTAFGMRCWHTESSTSTDVHFAAMLSSGGLMPARRRWVKATELHDPGSESDRNHSKMDYGVSARRPRCYDQWSSYLAYAGDGRWIQADPVSAPLRHLDGRTR